MPLDLTRTTAHVRFHPLEGRIPHLRDEVGAQNVQNRFHCACMSEPAMHHISFTGCIICVGDLWIIWRYLYAEDMFSAPSCGTGG